MANVFAHDLQTKSLKDLQPRIAEQIDDLIFQVDSKESLDVSFSRVNSKFNTFTNRNSYRPQYNDQRRATFDSRNTSGFQRDTR